ASLTMKIKDLSQSSAQHQNVLKQKDGEITRLQGILNEKAEIEDGAEKLLQQIRQIRTENEKLHQEIEKLNETNKKLKFQVLKAQRESETHLETINNLKLAQSNIQQAIDSRDAVQKQSRDEIFELKKEIKVLRREKDHYEEILKKNKLL
ncbi:MAG: hypothetical protein ACFFD7_17570, partial [Candidatus Thorarchaeota archaeon]